MAAHKYWRIRILKDSDFYGGGNYYLNVKEMNFFDAAMTRLIPVAVTSNGYFGAYPPSQAFDGNTTTILSLNTNPVHAGSFSWVVAEFSAPVSASYFRYLGDGANCPTEFAIDWSDDGIVFKESIRHTMSKMATEAVFLTGSRVASSAAGAFPVWRIRMTVDTGSQYQSDHYINFGSIKFINASGSIVPAIAAFSSPANTGNGTPTNAFNGGATAIYTNGLYVTPRTECFIGMAASAAFRPTKVQFTMPSGAGSQASNASFVLEASTNGRTWFQEAEYINQPFVTDTLMDFAVPGALNSDMTMKKLSELPYTELNAAQAKDALIPLSGIGDEVDTLYKVTLADLAAMLVNAENVGTDYHKEHRGWRIIFRSSSTGTQTIGDLTFLDRAGNTIPTTGGSAYTYNGDGNIPENGAQNAFDGNPGTIASSGSNLTTTNTATQPFGVGYIFAQPQDVGSFKITPATSYVANAPTAFAIQYSDDGGISWTSFASYENITDWASGISKQFYLPSAGIATSGINYGKDFWRSLDFSTSTLTFDGRNAFLCSQIISGAAPGRRLVIEAMIKKSKNGSCELFVGPNANVSYSIAAQSDSNFVSYVRSANVRTAAFASGSPTTGNDANYDYAGYYHLKMEINIGDVAAQYHSISAWVNGYGIPFNSSAAINLAQDLKIYVDCENTYENIKWVHYRWDDNGLDIPVLSGGSSGGGDNGGGDNGGGTVVVGGSPTRYYRLGGFATLSPQANETLMLNAVADPFVFGANFVGSSGKANNPPLATYVCSVRKNGTEIGTMTVATTGAVTFATTGGAAVLVQAGDVISVVGAATPDTGLSNLAFTLVGVTNTTAVYLGARVVRNTIAPDAVGGRIVRWEVEDHDDGGFWTAAAPDRFVVPAGVTKVRISAGIQSTNATSGTTLWLGVLKNSADPDYSSGDHLMAINKVSSEDFVNAAAMVDTGVIRVVEGDYFTLRFNAAGDTSVGIDSATSFFSIEAVDGSALLSGEPDILQPTPLLVTPTYRFGFFFDYGPEANERLGIHIASDAFTFANDFAGSIGFVETPPAAPFVMQVKKNNTDVIGTITVGISGAVTFDSTSSTTTPIAIGDRISLIAPASKDTVIAGGAFTFKGTF